MDNIHLLTEQKSGVNTDCKLLEARYKYGMVLIGLALLKDHQTSNNESSTDSETDIYQKISYITRAVSPILLPMISGLGDLDIEDAAETYEENTG
ncbi:MAG: hypothetical protein WC454_09555 [Phycisphaerae bacterium]|jgi:hypothetical protein